jgi:hypothetical protein
MAGVSSRFQLNRMPGEMRDKPDFKFTFLSSLSFGVAKPEDPLATGHNVFAICPSLVFIPFG